MSQPQPGIPKETLPPITFQAGGDLPETREANLETVKPSPGYPNTVLLLADAITKRADLILLDYTAQGASVRYQVDGIWHNMPPMDRGTGDYMLATMKQLADLDYRQRRQRQTGTFVAEYLRQKHTCRITTQGVPTGERVVITVERKRPSTENLEEIGMRQSMREQLIPFLNEAGGIILFSALPGDGLTTTWRAAMQSADRFMRDCFVIEEKSAQEPEVINVTSVTYDQAAGETPVSVLRGLLLREPHVIGFSEMPDAQTVNEMTRLAEQDKTILARVHARHAVEAVLRVLALKPEVPAFARSLKAVVGQRLVRRLCEGCRQPFRPNPNLIAQLGLPPARVPLLYTHFQPKPEELVDQKGNPIDMSPCEACGGPGYMERTGVFELLLVDDRFRAVLQSQPTVQKLALAAQQSGHVSLRDEGVVLVARGSTSLEELQRVLKK